MSTATAPANDSNWDKIAFYLRHAISAFGDPAKLAQQLWLSIRDHRLFTHYMRPLEQAVRHLIFIAALDLTPVPLPAPPERKFRPRLGMPTNAGATFEPTKPETWRAAFKLGSTSWTAGASPASSHQPQRMPAKAPAAQANRVSSAPSALRLEALIRAYEQRDKLAAALARKLVRDARKAFAYIARRKPTRTKLPAYVALNFQPDAAQAHQTWLHKKLDAVLPKTPPTDSS